MQETSSLPVITFFMFITSASIGSMLASTATIPLPPPLPSAPNAHKCPDALSPTKVGQLLRSGEKAGVITRKEGLTEEEVVSAMMSQKTPQKEVSSPSKPAAKKMPTETKSQAQMMEELNKKLASRQSGSSLQKPTGQASEEERSLRQSSPGRLETTTSNQPESEKPAWMKNLKRKSTGTSTPSPSTSASGQPEEEPAQWRSRLRKSIPETSTSNR